MSHDKLHHREPHKGTSNEQSRHLLYWQKKRTSAKEKQQQTKQNKDMTNTENTSPHKGQKRPHTFSSPFADFQITDTSILDRVPKAHCPKCHRNSRYFCYKCLDLVGDFPEGSVPQLKLPIRLDIIKHEQERDGKSTALHAGVLAPRDVTVYEWNQMPQYENVDRLLLLFPSEVKKKKSRVSCLSITKKRVFDLFLLLIFFSCCLIGPYPPGCETIERDRPCLV